jgi:hypothetical protein
MSEPSRTIPEFCAMERVSRGTFYNWEKQGKAPRTYNVGPIRRITPDAHAEWRREREADGERAAKSQRERQRARVAEQDREHAGA